MKTKLMTGLRSATAASGVALLMLVAACGDSDDEPRGEQPASEEEAAEESQDTDADDPAAEEEGADTGADASDEEAAEEPAEGTEEGGDEDAAADDGGAAGGAAAPGDSFDPCTAITADDINGILGTEFEEGTSNDMSSVMMCTFADMSDGKSVIVQWAPVPGSLDDALAAMESLYGELEEPEQVSVAGADEAAVLSGTISEMDATVLIATAEGGFLQVVSTAQDMSSDQAVEIAEATFAGV